MSLTRVKDGWVNPAFINLLKLPKPNWPVITGELPYGWAGELAYPNTMGFDHHWDLYNDMARWICENIKNPETNVFWNKLGDCIYVQFRKKQDMMWFVLRFGQ